MFPREMWNPEGINVLTKSTKSGTYVETLHNVWSSNHDNSWMKSKNIPEMFWIVLMQLGNVVKLRRFK